MIVSTIVFPSAYGQEPKNFGFKVMPEKLVEGTEGILQVYGLQNNIPLPDTIENLIVTSSDQDVVKILELSTNIETAITSVKLKAEDPGTVNLAIAAPGFVSEEFSVTVFPVKQGEQQLLVKTVPDKFTTNGPTNGYFSVQLADADSNPTLASQDIFVSITSSNSEMVTLFQDEIIIYEGHYYALGEFQVNNPGEVTIYAEAPNTIPDGSKVTIFGALGDEDSEDSEEEYIIQLYVIPEKISNFATSSTYAIAQLQGSDGSPIIATENIPVTLKVDYADSTFNEKRTDEISTVNSLVIPPGSTTGFAKMSVKAGLEEVYKVSISAEDYLVSDSVNFQTIMTPDIDEPLTKLDTIPLLASSSEQLIGVLYPSDENGVALLNIESLDSEINSSDLDALAISDDRIEKGAGAKLIYGKMGQIKTDTLEVTVVGEENQIVFPTVFGPEKEDLELVAEPLVTKVMPQANFPMMVYLTNIDEANWYFPDTSNVVMGPNESVRAPVQTVSEGQSSVMLNAFSIKEGISTLEFQASEYTANLEIDTGISKPAKIDLAYPDHLITGMKNTLSLQILDNEENPIFAGKDIEFRVATDDGTIEVPQNVVIKKGEYSAFFDIIPEKPVEAEISVLASDFPLSKFTLNTVETNPSLIISTVNSIGAGEVFDLVLDAKVLDIPLSNVMVNWNVEGAQIQEVSQSTDNNGKIKMTLVADDVDKINVKATTAEFDQISISKEIQIIKPGEAPIPSVVESEENFVENNLGFILIPGVVIGSSILLRKRSLLEPIAERVPAVESALDRIDELFERLEFTERLESIKEKIPIIKNR